jgi:hypothetical protein
MESNGQIAMALLIVKAENCSSGIEQLQGSILQNSISAKTVSDKFYSSNFEEMSTRKPRIPSIPTYKCIHNNILF